MNVRGIRQLNIKVGDSCVFVKAKKSFKTRCHPAPPTAQPPALLDFLAATRAKSRNFFTRREVLDVDLLGKLRPSSALGPQSAW